MKLWHRLKRFLQRFKKRLTVDVEDQIADIVKSRRELIQVFDGLSDPIVMINKQFTIQRVNRTTLTVLGKKSFMQFIGKPCYEMLHGLKEHCPQCTAPLTFSSGVKTERTGHMGAKENSLLMTYKISCYPIISEKGEVISIAEYYSDCTDIVNLTRQLYESERARVMESLTAGLTHQVRQPLTIIRAAAQYVVEKFKNTLKGEDLEESMDSIIQNVDTLNGILTDFLHFSKPLQYQMKKGCISKLMEQGLRLVQQKITEQKISVVKECPQDLPEILMDEKLLLQAYLNLLINALESMTKGGQLNVRASYVKKMAPPQIYITIEDTGTGISQELLPKIFQPFFSTKKDGIGLGLHVAEEVIRSHGGGIRLESQEGQGTKAVINLPLTS